MPAPTMMTSSPISPPGPFGTAFGRGYNRSLSSLSIGELRSFDETHAHARVLVGRLANQPLGAAPGQETRIVGGFSADLAIAMRAPAIVIFGGSQLLGAAQLRAAGKTF